MNYRLTRGLTANVSSVSIKVKENLEKKKKVNNNAVMELCRHYYTYIEKLHLLHG